MPLENYIDRLQIEFGRHVADRAILVVEILGSVGAVIIAGDQMFEHLPMAEQVIAEVHRHEAAKLKKAGVNLATRTAIMRRHRRDDILLEP